MALDGLSAFHGSRSKVTSAGVTPKRCNVAKENGGSCSACSSRRKPAVFDSVASVWRGLARPAGSTAASSCRSVPAGPAPLRLGAWSLTEPEAGSDVEQGEPEHDDAVAERHQPCGVQERIDVRTANREIGIEQVGDGRREGTDDHR